MESLSMVFSCPPPPQNHLKTHKPVAAAAPIPPPPPTSATSIKTTLQTQPQKPLLQAPFSRLKNSHFHAIPKTHLSFVLTELITSTAFTPPSFASEAAVSSAEQASERINLETILVSIDDFFNRNPFFVAGCTFVWLVVIPLVQEYLRKYKFVLVIDAFRKLRDDPNAQLLDIRDDKSLKYLKSPNLKMLNKAAVQVQFLENDEDGFVKRVLERFGNPADTVLCILGNFDDISIKVAEFLFKNGFKEAYAIKGGVGGTKGWLESQETLLPPSMHMFPKKKVKASEETAMNGGVVRGKEDSNGAVSSVNAATGESQRTDDGQTTNSTDSVLHARNGSRPLSPYPSYPDLKPPSSPTPSKP